MAQNGTIEPDSPESQCKPRKRMSYATKAIFDYLSISNKINVKTFYKAFLLLPLGNLGIWGFWLVFVDSILLMQKRGLGIWVPFRGFWLNPQKFWFFMPGFWLSTTPKYSMSLHNRNHKPNNFFPLFSES